MLRSLLYYAAFADIACTGPILSSALQASTDAVPEVAGSKPLNAIAAGSLEEELAALDGQFSLEDLPENTSAGFSRNCYVRPTRASSRMVARHFGQQTWGMKKLMESEWARLPPVQHLSKPPKLAVLIFVKDRVFNPNIWVKWANRARKDGLPFTILVHAYGIKSPNDFQPPEFLEYLLPRTATTSWCKMWEAEMLLLKHGLADGDVTHFMVVSHDAIPVKPLRYIYAELERDPATRMCADDNWVRPWPRAESWWLMRRADAQLFVENEEFARGNFLSGCTEEQAWYYPLRLREDNFGDSAVVRNECPVFTDWADGPKACKDWKKHVEDCDCGLLRGSNRTNSGFCHPAQFFDVNQAALKGLVDSPFWFARKFAEGAIHEDAAQLLE